MFLIVLVFAWITYFSPPTRIRILVPVWKVDVNVAPIATGLIILSDQIVFNSPRNYSLQLVNVSVGNSRFVALLNSIISFCEQTVSGTLTKDSKQIFAEAPLGKRPFIATSIEGETVPFDNTLIQSLDAETSSTIQAPISQTMSALRSV